MTKQITTLLIVLLAAMLIGAAATTNPESILVTDYDSGKPVRIISAAITAIDQKEYTNPAGQTKWHALVWTNGGGVFHVRETPEAVWKKREGVIQ